MAARACPARGPPPEARCSASDHLVDAVDVATGRSLRMRQLRRMLPGPYCCFSDPNSRNRFRNRHVSVGTDQGVAAGRVGSTGKGQIPAVTDPAGEAGRSQLGPGGAPGPRPSKPNGRWNALIRTLPRSKQPSSPKPQVILAHPPARDGRARRQGHAGQASASSINRGQAKQRDARDLGSKDLGRASRSLSGPWRERRIRIGAVRGWA